MRDEVPSTVHARPRYTYPTAMKQDGWTEKLILEILGPPDNVVVNPHHRSGPPIRRYRVERVAAGRSDPRYQAAQVARGVRRSAAHRAVETKRAKLAEALKQIKIKVPKMRRKQLVAEAVEHYNMLQFERRNEGHASTSDSEEFLNRIMVNYLRHELSPYEYELARIHGKVGALEGRLEIQAKIYAAIAKAYPFLSCECDRQLAQRYLREAL